MTRPRLHSNRGLVPVHQYLFPPALSWGCWDDGSPGCFPQPSLHLSVLPIPMAQVKSLSKQLNLLVCCSISIAGLEAKDLRTQVSSAGLQNLSNLNTSY